MACTTGKKCEMHGSCFGCKTVIGTHFMICGTKSEDDAVGWLKPFVLHFLGRGTLILWFEGQSQKTTQLGWLRSFILHFLGRSWAEHKDSLKTWKCPAVLLSQSQSALLRKLFPLSWITTCRRSS
jgi:hypothetical protein